MTCDFTTKEKDIARKFIGLYLEDEYLVTAYKDNDGTYVVHGYKRDGEADGEPNSSEKPNNCETCKHYHPDYEAIACERCLGGKYSRYEPKTEPETEKKFPRSTEKPIRMTWVDEDLNALGETEPQTKMTLDDAYYLVYKDLTKMDGILTGKYDAKNGSKQYMHGVWTVMELIAYGVGIDCYEAFNERFCRNLEKSQGQTKESETDCAWKKGE